MRQVATVEWARDGEAELSVRRESACSGDCHKCAGCGAVAQTLRIKARDPLGTVPGDRVYVESESAPVLWAAALVYLCPLVLFLAAYLLGVARGWGAWPGLLGFLLGWIPALCYNRRMKKHPPQYTVVGFVK